MKQETTKPKNAKQKETTRKLAFAGLLTALAAAGSLLSIPVAGSRCAPAQHMVNVLAAVTLGPWWGFAVAFCASTIRNLTGLGTLMAYPGSMAGALLCGLVFRKTGNLSWTCMAETAGTCILGGLLAYPVAKYLMGAGPAGFAVYVVPFFISTAAGSVLAFGMITALEKGRLLEPFRGMR